MTSTEITYWVNMSPGPVPARTTMEQIFAVTGVSPAETLLSVIGPSTQPGLTIVSSRVVSTNEIAVMFNNETAWPITPKASPLYKVVTTYSSGASYHANAVHFDGASWLGINSLTATNNAFLSLAFWFKCNFADSSGRYHWVTDPNGFTNNSAFSYGGNGWSIELNNKSTSRLVVSTDTGMLNGVWYCVVASFDVNRAIGARRFKIYVNDVNMAFLETDSGSAFTLFVNALGMSVGGDGFGDGYIGDMANFMFMPGASLLDGTGDIPVATRRLFIDASGKPVDPAVAIGVLGNPCVLFSGNATAFATNQGTGGSFTLNGSLTNATTSPSD